MSFLFGRLTSIQRYKIVSYIVPVLYIMLRRKGTPILIVSSLQNDPIKAVGLMALV